VILPEAEPISEYTGNGDWGNKTLLDRFVANRAARAKREAVVYPSNRGEPVGTSARRLQTASGAWMPLPRLP
jgi:hypothetical protein